MTVAVYENVSVDKRGRAWGVRCTANRRDGEKCRKYAIRGHHVCWKHGGSLPVVRARARDTLALHALVAVGVIAELTRESHKDEVRLAAAREILQRVGMTSTGIRTPGSVRDQRELSAAKQLALGTGESADPEVDALIETLLEKLGS